jgi:hypothetical protein
MSRRLIALFRRNVVAWLALFLGATGTGVAASHYIITSTTQIKPSVLEQLRGNGPVGHAAAIPTGPKAVVARVRLSGGPLALAEGGEEAAIPITGGSWTQAAGQVNGLIGQLTVTSPSLEQCRGGRVTAQIDGSVFSVGRSYIEPRGEETATYQFGWEQRGVEGGYDGSTAWMLEPGAVTSHSIMVTGSGCSPGHHLTLDSLEIDVIAVR